MKKSGKEPARTFQDLVAWQKAQELTLSIYTDTAQFPSEEKFRLVSQLRRASMSVPANIAEGFKKGSKPDKLRFFNIAQASLEECRNYVLLARDLRYGMSPITQEKLDEASRVLQSLCLCSPQ